MCLFNFMAVNQCRMSRTYGQACGEMRFLGTIKGNMAIYFMGARGMLETTVTLDFLLKFREQLNLLTGNKEEEKCKIFKGSGECVANPWEALQLLFKNEFRLHTYIKAIKDFFRVYIASSKSEGSWENSRQLRKPETQSRICVYIKYPRGGT